MERFVLDDLGPIQKLSHSVRPFFPAPDPYFRKSVTGHVSMWQRNRSELRRKRFVFIRVNSWLALPQFRQVQRKS